MPDPKENETEEVLGGERDEAEADAGDEQEQDEAGDDGEDAPEGDGSEEEIAAAEEKPRRGETRFQKLANETKEARREAAELRQRLQDFEARQRPAAPQGESPEQEAQRLALMTSEERMEYRFQKAERTNQQTMAAMAFNLQDTGDKSTFNALCASDPVAAKYKDRVESELTRIRGLGQNVNREALLDYLIGKDVRSKRAPAAEKQRKAGERNIQRQQARPANARGDSAPAKRGEKSLEERLEGVTF